MATTTRTTGIKKTPASKVQNTSKTTSTQPVAKKTKPAVKKPVTKEPTAQTLTPSTTSKKLATKVTGTASKPAAKRVRKPAISDSERRHMIATAAYFLAEQRGFSTGYEVQDWIAAEVQIEAQLKSKS